MTTKEWKSQKWGFGMVGTHLATGIEYPITAVDLSEGMVQMDMGQEGWDELKWFGYNEINVSGQGVHTS